MIIDDLLKVSSAQAFTATAASTDVIDLLAARDIGRGTPLWCVAVCRVAMGGTSPTAQLSVETDDNAARSSVATIAQSQAFAAMAVGDRIILPLPPGPYERFLGAKLTLGGTSPTGTFDIFFTDQDPSAWRSYNDAL